MTIHELFELHYSDQNETTVENVKSCRMSNGSYNNLPIARAFRMFKAGFEANAGGKMQFLGYLSKKGSQSASQGRAAMFYARCTRNATQAVYVKQCDDLKEGEES